MSEQEQAEAKARQGIGDLAWSAWVYHAGIHREAHGTPWPGCVICDGKVKLDAWGLPLIAGLANRRYPG